MRVLVFHGYLLRGTGSNVYNANLAPALAALGHEVHLLCQDRAAGELEWVNAVGSWQGGGLSVERVRRPEGKGSVTVYTPDIGGLLPVYVADRYDGFEVKTFPELTDAELDAYVGANLAALRDVVAAAGAPDAALANHLIMGPVILARAGLRFACKVHGSDLSYAVRPHPDRFVPFAREGMEAASAALVGSRHTAEDLWETVALPGLPERTRLGPPGVDSELFSPLPREAAAAAVLRLAERLEATQSGLGFGHLGSQDLPPEGIPDLTRGGFGRDPRQAARALRWFARAPGARVLYVGKLLVNKGVDLLLAAWPLIVRGHPGARLLIVGFGAYREPLDRLWAALGRGDLADARLVASAGRALEGADEPEAAGPDRPLRLLSAFLADPPGGYVQACRAAAGSVAVSGRLEHEEVAEVMPAADVFVMPSTMAEAFGMVAAEAAACGVPPVSADHSGMREVSRQLADAVGPELSRFLAFPVEPGAVEAIARCVDGWLALDVARRETVAAALARRVDELWSWRGVARGVIAASLGRLDELTPVPGRR